MSLWIADRSASLQTIFTVSQKSPTLKRTAQNYKDQFCWNLAETFIIEFKRFSFHVGLFFINFHVSNPTPKITRILTLYQTNAATLMLFDKEDNSLIKNLHECKGYNI